MALCKTACRTAFTHTASAHPTLLPLSLLLPAMQSKSILELQGKLHDVKRQRDALLLQLEGPPGKTMRSCGVIDESEFLLAADEELGCWQQHDLHSAEHDPRHDVLLFSH